MDYSLSRHVPFQHSCSSLAEARTKHTSQDLLIQYLRRNALNEIEIGAARGPRTTLGNDRDLCDVTFHKTVWFRRLLGSFEAMRKRDFSYAPNVHWYTSSSRWDGELDAGGNVKGCFEYICVSAALRVQ